MRWLQCTIHPPKRIPVCKMLLELALWLGQDIRGFNVFGYITLRTVLAALTALAISLVAGPAVIRWLAAKKIGQAVRDDGPKSHLTKAGTPTMGGALILISIAISASAPMLNARPMSAISATKEAGFMRVGVPPPKWTWPTATRAGKAAATASISRRKVSR